MKGAFPLFFLDSGQNEYAVSWLDGTLGRWLPVTTIIMIREKERSKGLTNFVRGGV